MTDYLIDLISHYGYLGMFLGMVLEAVIIVIPSEFILATGGFLAANHVFTFFNAFLIGLLGSIFCAIILYFIGYFGGRRFIVKYGKYFFIHNNDFEKTEIWFNKYGLIASLVGRNLPIIRTLISIPVGIARLKFTTFLLYTTLGSLPWTFVFVYVGYILGNNEVLINKYLSYLKIPIMTIFLVILTTYLIKKLRASINN